MEQSNANATGQQIKWYARPAVEEFLDAAVAERDRLHKAIAESSERLHRARAASQMQQTMVAMLLEAELAVRQVRRDAQREAAVIIAAADAEATAIHSSGGLDPGFRPQPAPMTTAESDLTIDLVHGEDSRSDDFLEFLRGALVDDQPLGPRPE